MKNIRIFYLKILIFLVVKLSVYLNRRVFVMYLLTTVCFLLICPESGNGEHTFKYGNLFHYLLCKIDTIYISDILYRI